MRRGFSPEEKRPTPDTLAALDDALTRVEQSLP
jgi:hypothetical protein